MCGIVGYVGFRNVPDVLMDGLQKLEYRGYDSAGIAVLQPGGDFVLVKSEGKLNNLREKVEVLPPREGDVGIGHTRWATHGRPNEVNAHPHIYKDIVVVHNGIIENYLEIRDELASEGNEFYSETDTEVIAHLIYRHLAKGKSLLQSLYQATKELEGSFALGVLYKKDHGRFVATRKNSPLIVGLGKDENFVASDIPALLSFTNQIVYLQDGEFVEVTKEAATIYDPRLKPLHRDPKTITWSPMMAEKQGYKHYMLKEIHEQPRAITETMEGKVDKSAFAVDMPDLKNLAVLKTFQRVVLIGCGTAWHAGLVGKYIFEKLLRIPVEVDLASEFRYRDPVVGPETLIIPISQSGETADTLAAINEAKNRGATILAICNVLESSLARASHAVLYTQAGPEIGVASTKAFTTQVTMLYLLGLYIAKQRGTLAKAEEQRLVLELLKIPNKINEILLDAEQILAIAKTYASNRDFLFLGRGLNFPIALEGALKLKEISYIHAEGYAAGEMKHGPIALIDANMPVVVLAPEGSAYEKVMSNIKEVQARDGRVIAIVTKRDAVLPSIVPDAFFIPEIDEFFSPLLCVIPLQLLAYYTADFLGTDVDQPRNLAKSVTVE